MVYNSSILLLIKYQHLDKYPPCDLYSGLLCVLTERLKISQNEARKKIGSLTCKEIFSLFKYLGFIQ